MLRSICAAVWMLAWSACGASAAPLSHAASNEAHDDAALADSIATQLVRACPASSSNDFAARRACADALGPLPVLRDHLAATLRWGGQRAQAGYDLDASNTTLFNPFVFRRIYLSTFWFAPGHRIERVGQRVVLHVPATFRNTLDAGEYPYPFWHSASKWQSYEQTRTLLFFIEQGQVIAVLREHEAEPTRSQTERNFDGQWQWQSARGSEPRAALYSALFSPSNPHVNALDASYRAFAELQRQADCLTCHSPDNRTGMNPLELLSYPNQALSGRHQIVSQLEQNRMPPAHDGRPAASKTTHIAARCWRAHASSRWSATVRSPLKENTDDCRAEPYFKSL